MVRDAFNLRLSLVFHAIAVSVLLANPVLGQNQGWLPGFSSSGINQLAGSSGTAQSVDVIGSFTILAPGFFEGPAENGTQTYALAIWNGEYWRFEAPYNGSQFLGSTGGVVQDSAPLIAEACIGGTFNATTDLPSGYLNCWNGASWYELGGTGNGPNGPVNALAFDGDSIFAGGLFTAVGGTPANSIAYFDRSMNEWVALENGVQGGSVAKLVTSGPGVSLYAAGSFTSAGSVPNTWGIARWRTGFEAWSQVGSGGLSLQGEGILDITADGGSVYAAGGFTAIGEAVADRVASHQIGGNSWSGLGSPGSFFGAVDRIQVTPGGDLFALGPFDSAVDVLARYIPGSGIWVEPPGLDALKNISGGFPVIDMDAFGTNLYVLHSAGYDATINTLYAPYFARFDGADWHGLGTGIGGYGFTTDQVNAIQDFGEDVIVGGAFDNAGDAIIPLLARWDGNQWHSLGDGLERRFFTSSVNTLDVFQGNLYVGGDFGYQGNAESILRWDGSTLSMMPPGVDIRRVHAFDASGSFLFVGGSFNSVPTDPLRGIATFNGTTWGSIGGGANGDVHAIRVIGADIYIGGDIFGVNQNTEPVSNLAYWNGSVWDDLGGGVSRNAAVAVAAVQDIEVNGADVYVGGNITSAGGVPVSNIARWDGTQWRSLGQGVNGVVNDMVIIGNLLYVVGNFTEAGGQPANKIAVWNGVSWSALGWGLNCNCTMFGSARGTALYERPEALWVGGSFTFAGRNVSNNLARLDLDKILDSNFETNTVFGNPMP